MTNHFRAGFADELVKTAFIRSALRALRGGAARTVGKGQATTIAANVAKKKARLVADKASGVLKQQRFVQGVIPAKFYGLRVGVKGLVPAGTKQVTKARRGMSLKQIRASKQARARREAAWAARTKGLRLA